MQRKALYFILSILVGLAGHAAEISLKDGSVIKGDVVSQTDSGVTLKTAFGVQLIGRDAITDASWSALVPQSVDPAALVSHVTELERLVESLRQENQQLRQQLAQATYRSQPSLSQPAAPYAGSAPGLARTDVSTRSPQVSQGADNAAGYWITSTGKRHNSSCRYYGTTKSGHYGLANEGVACKICGG